MVITPSGTLYLAFGVGIEELSHGEKEKQKIMQNHGGIFGSNMKPLPSHLNLYAEALETKYIRDIPDGHTFLTEAILHCLDKFCNCYLSDLDVRDVIIEFFIKFFNQEDTQTLPKP